MSVGVQIGALGTELQTEACQSGLLGGPEGMPASQDCWAGWRVRPALSEGIRDEYLGNQVSLGMR